MEKMLSFDDLTPTEFAETYNTLVGTRTTGRNDAHQIIEAVIWTQYIPGPSGMKGSGLFLVRLDPRPVPAPVPGPGPSHQTSHRPDRQKPNRLDHEEPPL